MKKFAIVTVLCTILTLGILAFLNKLVPIERALDQITSGMAASSIIISVIFLTLYLSTLKSRS